MRRKGDLRIVRDTATRQQGRNDFRAFTVIGAPTRMSLSRAAQREGTPIAPSTFADGDTNA